MVDTWKRRILQAVGDSAQVIADVIPEITLLLGPQRPVSAVGPMETLSVETLIVEPLGTDALSELIAESLQCGLDEVEELSSVILQKTNGNPFFVDEFLQDLNYTGDI